MDAALAIAWIEEFDRTVMHWINCDLGAPLVDDVLLTLQRKEVGVGAFVALLLGVALWRPRRAHRAFASALLGYGIVLGLAVLMWATLGRPRPAHTAPVLLRTPAEIATCAEQPDAVVLRKHASRRPGFPSQHACSSGVLAMTTWCIARWLGVLGFLYAFLVAVGRVYAGVHWPTDVLAGLLLGGLAGALSWRLVPSLFGRFGRRAWVEEPPAPVPAPSDSATALIE